MIRARRSSRHFMRYFLPLPRLLSGVFVHLINPLSIAMYARVRHLGKRKPRDFAAEDTNEGGWASVCSSLYLLKRGPYNWQDRYY